MPDLLPLADERFVSLITYRRSGAAVATPVWVARHGDELVVVTSPTTGKVRRLRRDPRVALQPCDRRGRVPDGAAAAMGRATIVTDPAETAGPLDALRAKYRAEWWAVQAIMVVERWLRRGPGERVILRIEPAAG